MREPEYREMTGHVPLYTNADGTTWYRIIQGPLTDRHRNGSPIDWIKHALNGDASWFRMDLDPPDILFACHDPSPVKAARRRDRTHIVNPGIVSKTHHRDGPVLRLYPEHEFVTGEIAGFLGWAFTPNTHMLLFGMRRETIGKKLWMAKGREPGTPLIDISTYKLLGLNPLLAPEAEFLAWYEANQP